ncbi:MAG TPA: 23S rRNA (pseudouridine(1915)-N(3))-methyltransferase RlmH [Longimicrobiales bacterium]|nr:23S rRNA (pseudouridine(1915)-N(3))-methyltransferase RlmH [Longimicrobiales bacterium]
MKLLLIAVGRPGRVLARAITEYEARARRYWSLDVVEVKEERARAGLTPDHVRDAEAKRLLERAPKELEWIALTRTGDAWSSRRLARHIERTAVLAGAGMAFLIGGSLGLGDAVLRAAQRRMRLSTYTFPHDLARLVLLEQLYRAGTIVRGEPYHKGGDES